MLSRGFRVGSMFRRQDLLKSRPRAEVDEECSQAESLRRGFYVPKGLIGEHRHRAECEVVQASLRSEAVLAGPSAALIWGLPVQEVPPEIFVRGVTPSGKRKGVRELRGPAPSVTVNGLDVTPAALTVVDCARLLTAREGVMLADSALNKGLCTQAELLATLEGLGRVRRVGRARWVIAESDPLAESAGESWTRLVLRDLGYEPVSQYLLSGDGLRAYVDFMLEDRLGIEFDGEVKYTNRGVLVREKVRHSQAEECGKLLMRVVWHQLYQPQRIDRRIRSYGLTPTRPPRGPHP